MSDPNNPRPGRGAKIAESIGAFVQSTAQALIGWLLLTILIGASPAVFLWPVLHEEHAEYLADNTIEGELRREILIWVLLSIALTLLVYLGVWWWRRRRCSEAISVPDFFRRFNRYTAVLFVLPLYSVLTIDELETENPFVTLFVSLMAAGVVGYFAYCMAGLVPSDFPKQTLPEKGVGAFVARLAWAAVVVMAAIYAWRMSTFHIIHHRNFGTSIFDLGLYENILWQSMNGDWLGCSYLTDSTHLGAHFDPILVLISPLYSLVERAEFLLVFQSIWLAIGAIPLYGIALHRTRRADFGIALVVAYLLYPAMHGLNLFDFHSLSLCIPPAIWLIYLLETGRKRLYWVAFLVLLSTREDMSLLATFIGLYAILERKAVVLGLTTILFSICYLTVVKLWLMTDSYEFVHYFSDLRPEGVKGVRGVLWSVITNPVFVLTRMIAKGKVLYFFKLLFPLLLLPLFSGRMTILFIFGSATILLATRPFLFDISFQYSSWLVPFFMAAVPAGAVRLANSRILAVLEVSPGRLVLALSAGMVVSSFLISQHFGVFWENSAFRAGFVRFRRVPTEVDRERYELIRKLQEEIPSDATVAASEKLGPHFSNRDDIFKYPKVRDTEYILVRKRDIKKKDKEYLRDLRSSKDYVVIAEGNGIYAYRRRNR